MLATEKSGRLEKRMTSSQETCLLSFTNSRREDDYVELLLNNKFIPHRVCGFFIVKNLEEKKHD